MRDASNLRFILHVSDFHLSDDPKDISAVRDALTALTRTLKTNKFKVDSLVHTGDVIESGDLYNTIAEELAIGDSFWEDEIDEESGTSQRKFLHKKYQETARENAKAGVKSGEGPNIGDLKVFDDKVADRVKRRFKIAKNIISDFVTDLNVAFGNVVICCGNHDVLRPLAIDDSDVTCKGEMATDGYTRPPVRQER